MGGREHKWSIPPTKLHHKSATLIECRRERYDLKKGDIDRATRQVIRHERHERRNTIIRPLLEPLSEQDQPEAKELWHRLSAIFEMSYGLVIAILQHFVWQVFQKVLGRDVVHHLVPVIVSPVQGSGKTTFVTRFLSPLRELVTGAALLSDFADRRSADIFRFPVVFLDDVEKIPPAMVPVLKSLITAEHIRRRRLGTSMSIGIRQGATPIGTANASIRELIDDDTGHRRFAMLPFRNGNQVKGGDPEVWRIVSSSNFELVWRSVDAFGPSPILSHLEDLALHQGRWAPKDPLLQWLQGLDLKSEVMLRISNRHGVGAQALHNLYVAQTGATISPQRFAEAMQRHCIDPAVPFGGKRKLERGAVYTLKSSR